MNVNLCRPILELCRLPSLKNQTLSHSLSAICNVTILIKQEYIPDCTASPSVLNIDDKCWPGLTPTLNNSQLIKGKGQKECHLLEQRLFQTIKL